MNFKQTLSGILIVAALVAGAGCAQKPREIPMATLVQMYLKVADAKALDAPAAELDVYAKPYGFTGADFRHTMALVNNDDTKKKQFNDLSVQAISDEVNRILSESADTTSKDTAK